MTKLSSGKGSDAGVASAKRPTSTPLGTTLIRQPHTGNEVACGILAHGDDPIRSPEDRPLRGSRQGRELHARPISSPFRLPAVRLEDERHPPPGGEQRSREVVEAVPLVDERRSTSASVFLRPAGCLRSARQAPLGDFRAVPLGGALRQRRPAGRRPLPEPQNSTVYPRLSKEPITPTVWLREPPEVSGVRARSRSVLR